jgi:hypothetical protein
MHTPRPTPTLQVLALLPDGVPLGDVMPWLEGALRYAVETRRHVAVIKQLRRGENLAAREEAARMRSQRVLVSVERACSLCHKRLGGAAFVSYPGGALAHYLCHKRHAGGDDELHPAHPAGDGGMLLLGAGNVVRLGGGEAVW